MKDYGEFAGLLEEKGLLVSQGSWQTGRERMMQEGNSRLTKNPSRRKVSLMVSTSLLSELSDDLVSVDKVVEVDALDGW